MTAALEPGQVFARDFRVERQLSQGGMGAVYIARQLSTDKLRALKLMHPQLVPDAKSRERFVAEARVGARIESEHVVEVLAAGVDEATGVPWLAMELLDGEDLGALSARRGALPVGEVRDAFAQLGHALGAAHAQGIVHRDLKPENLFLARSRRQGQAWVLKVLDFGIATALPSGAGAKVTTAVGSPLWMAPEQARPGDVILASTDVWALGLIAFQLLTGRSYWRVATDETASIGAVLTEILMDPLVPAGVRAAELRLCSLPDGFDAWFARCVTRTAEERFADAGVAVEALDAVLAQVSERSPLVAGFATGLEDTQQRPAVKAHDATRASVPRKFVATGLDDTLQRISPPPSPQSQSSQSQPSAQSQPSQPQSPQSQAWAQASQSQSPQSQAWAQASQSQSQSSPQSQSSAQSPQSSAQSPQSSAQSPQSSAQSPQSQAQSPQSQASAQPSAQARAQSPQWAQAQASQPQSPQSQAWAQASQSQSSPQSQAGQSQSQASQSSATQPSQLSQSHPQPALPVPRRGRSLMPIAVGLVVAVVVAAWLWRSSTDQGARADSGPPGVLAAVDAGALVAAGGGVDAAVAVAETADAAVAMVAAGTDSVGVDAGVLHEAADVPDAAVAQTIVRKPAPRKPAAPPPPPKAGMLSLITSAACDVTIDGAAVGQSPLNVPLAPGAHKVVLKNKAKDFSRELQALIASGEATTMTVEVPEPLPDTWLVEGVIEKVPYRFEALTRDELKEKCLAWVLQRFKKKNAVRKLTANAFEMPEESVGLDEKWTCRIVVQHASLEKHRR